MPGFLILACSYFFLFLLGLLSDLRIFESAKKRFLFKSLIIFLFVFINELQVTPTKIDFFDNLIRTPFGAIFSQFCLMILINGSNFIDGLNGLVLGYFSLVILIIFKLDLIYSVGFLEEKLFYFVLIIFFILILNLLNKLFLGDSGAYSLSFLIGFILIQIYNDNKIISPYFIILLLWYPCFENLFSIIRKIYNKKNPFEPDTDHIHQQLFLLLKKKFSLTNFTSNISSSFLILLFNFCIFYVGSQNISHTILQIFLLLICVIIYLFFFFFLKKINKLHLSSS